MSTNDLPLDEAALQSMCESANRWCSWTDTEKGVLITQARVALTLSARVAELEGEVAAQSWDVLIANAHANALRDALVKCAPGGCEREDDCRAMKRWRDWWREHGAPALASTPAASLAAYRKSVETEADREWATALCAEDTRVIERVTTRVLNARALAAQEVKRNA